MHQSGILRLASDGPRARPAPASRAPVSVRWARPGIPSSELEPRNQMQTLRTIAELRRALRPFREGGAIGLVPTMGALHAGHETLLRTARQECGLVVATVFVNPAQFGDPADLAAYPSDLAADARLAGASGADILFAPAAAELYPPGYATWIEPAGAAEGLEGDH